MDYKKIKEMVDKKNYLIEKEELHNEYKNILQNRRNWYNHNGSLKNFAKLYEFLNEEVLYDILYQSWSLDVYVRSNKNFYMSKINSQQAFLGLVEHDPIETDLIIK